MEGQLFDLRAIQNFRAPKKEGGQVVYKAYNQDEIIQGSVHNQASTPANYAEVYKTADGFIILKSNVQVLGPATIQRGAPEKDATLSAPSSPAAASVDKIVGSVKKRSSATVKGAMIGAGIGLVFAMFKGKNKLISAAIGAAAGGAIGNAYSKYTGNEDKGTV